MYNNKDKCHRENGVRAKFTNLSVVQIQQLKLHQAIGKALSVVDKRFDGMKMLLEKVRIIQYPKGGFMSRHVDKQPSPKYLGRIIIMPPKSDYPYSGGILRTFTEETDGFEVYYNINNNHEADDKKWTAVYVPYGMPHEITKVHKGTRYSFIMDVTQTDIDSYPIYEAEEMELDDGAFYEQSLW